MKKPIQTMTNHEILECIIEVLCREFDVLRRDMFKMPNKENILLLMAISMSLELSSLSSDCLAQVFGVKTSREVGMAPRRLKKYFLFIPGLQPRYEKIKLRIIKRADEF